jgi:hypothetical protein
MAMQAMKFEYELKLKEMEIRMKDIIIQCEKEKNEYLLMKMNIPLNADLADHKDKLQQVHKQYHKQAIPAVAFYETLEAIRSRPSTTEAKPEPAPEVEPEQIPAKKSKFELLEPVPVARSEPVPEPKAETTKPESPKGKKFKTLKDFVEQKCVIGENTFQAFMTKIQGKITDLDISKLAAKRMDKHDYVFQLIREVFEGYDKYNKPFYNDDKYHKKVYCLDKDKKWAKEDIKSNVGAILSTIRQVILDRAEALGKVSRYTAEQVEEIEEQTGQRRIWNSFIETKEYKNLDIMDYEDYDVFYKEMIDRFNEIIYISKKDIN